MTSSFPVSALAYAEDARVLLIGTTNVLTLFHDGQVKCRVAIPGVIRNIAVRADARRIAVVGDDKTLRTYAWNGDVMRVRGSAVHKKRLTCVAFGDAGGSVVMVGDKFGDGYVHAWKELKESSIDVEEFGAAFGTLSSLTCFLPLPGHRLALGERDEKILIVRTALVDEVVAICLGHSLYVTALASAVVGGALVLFSVSGDSTVRAWNTETGRAVCEPLTLDTDVPLREVVACGNNLFVTGQDGSVVLVPFDESLVWGTPTKLDFLSDVTTMVAKADGSGAWVGGHNGLVFWTTPTERTEVCQTIAPATEEEVAEIIKELDVRQFAKQQSFHGREKRSGDDDDDDEVEEETKETKRAKQE